ncbi:MAG: MobF family relaxase [Streptosporangiaceae bacterium]
MSIARGNDASYPFKTIGSADGATLTGERGPGYYLSAVEKGGEPAGIWIGSGAADLGFNDGDVVRREDFEPLYGHFLDPRDPTHQTYLGSPPRVNAELYALYQAKVAAEPGLTSERKAALWVESRAEYQGPVGVQYWDTTFSVDKTISLAHASAMAAAVQAAAAGDREAAGLWEARAAGIWGEIEKSVRLYIAFMQREAGFVRTGHHGRRISGAETGRFEDAHEIPVAIFPQHTSRNGDPQLHVHILWLNKVQTVRDGAWRAIDSRGLHRNKGAGSALAAFALESGLSRRFGFEWAYRPASRGRVIAGVPDKAIRAFSSRRAQITRFTQALAEQYERERGHPPDQRAAASMRQFANSRTRQAKEDGALDFAALLRDWEDSSRRAELGTLRDLARVVWHAAPRTRTDATRLAAELASRGLMTFTQERAVMAAGLAQVQESRAAWGRADLIACIGQHLPDHAAGAGQEQAWRLLEDLACRALAGEAGEEVLRLDAPEWPRVPDALRRAGGESIYRPHGCELYATRAQLSLEEQMLAQAQAEDAPHLTREQAAALLGADLAQLEAQLRADAHAHDGVTTSGLRVDQAAAAFLALASPRRVELIVGPAGTGKTYTAVHIAQAWRLAGMGRVYGIATTSAGRNVMLEAGIPLAENTAQFLGHLPGQRGARGATDIGPSALLILDEASMTSMPDLAGTIRHAARMGAKVIITGDHAQLAAVQAGGGMEMLARKLGYAQLTEAVRFREPWEGPASLAIRAGDVSALGTYDAHARLHGGSYEDMAEQACRAYLAEYLAGTDVVLTAYERRECADLSRRVQEYLLNWGRIQPGPAADLADGNRAHVGDLVAADQNDNRLEAGAAGRTLANGDILRVDAISAGTITVSRLTDDRTGDRRAWSAPFAISREYAAGHCDLGYALTWHAVEGRTVSVGIALANDNRTRSGLYPAMTRGEQRNDVYAYPASQEPAESVIGRGPAADPELARQRRLDAGRDQSGPGVTADEQDPVAILARVIRRDATQLSATETREQALSDADHFGVLHAIWTEHCRAAAYDRYAGAVRESASPADAEQILSDTSAVWRTVRAAELAGLDGADVIRIAIDGRPFTGARSHSAVLDARIARKTGHLPPLPRTSWTASLPSFDDPDLARYMTAVAAAMDDRQRRIGEHAAETQPLWATQALGAVPGDPARRAGWETRAGQIGAAREILGYDHPGRPLGPEPAATSPEARAAWHTALAAMARVDGIDVRGLSDGQLLARRRAYQAETAWAPKYVARELRAARRQEQLSRIEATRHAHEAAAATRRGEADRTGLHEQAARSWTALGSRATQIRETLAAAQDTRAEWEAITEPTLRLARAADLELKRRGTLSHSDHLVSAEPEGFTYPEPDSQRAQVWVQPRLDGGIEKPRTAEPATPAQREEQTLRALGLTLDYDQPELPLQVSQIAAYNRQRQAEIDERRSMRIPAEEPDELDLGEAWNVLAGRHRDVIIQPPRPQIPPAREVIEHAAGREAGN